MIDTLSSCLSNTDEQPEAAARAKLDHSKRKIRGLQDIYAKQRIQDTKKDVPRYLERLRACESLEDLRRIAANLDGKLHSRREFSQSAFRQLLHSGHSLEILLQFLSDPALNVQEARNLLCLWEWYISEPRSRTDSVRLHKWLRRHIFLGMQSKRELQDLIAVALRPSRELFGTQPDIDLSKTILDGLSSSGFDQINDLDGGILNQLLLLASSDDSWRNPELQSLGLKIIEKCKPAHFRNMTKGISSLVTSYLVSTSLEKEISSLDGPVSRILDCLSLGSEIEASRAIASISQAVLMRLGSSDPAWHLSKQSASGWWYLLLRHKIFEIIKQKSEWLRIERVLARHNSDVLCSYMKHLSDDEKCFFLLRHWSTQNFGDGDDHCASRVSDNIKLFKDDLVSRKGQKCPFILLSEYLGPTATTNRIVLLRLFSLLNKLELQETSLGLFSYFLQSNTSVDYTALAKDIIDFTSPTPLMACTLYKITPGLPLESCPSVAEMMIYNFDDGPSVPLGFRLLRRKSLGVSNVYPRTAAEIRHAQIELLNRMAVAYAQASHLYPRVAFRQVYQCYHLLLRNHGRSSLSIAFSRAFTLAGLIRPLQELRWVGTMQLKFVLRIVREIEGSEVALKVDELLYIWRGQLIGEKAKEAWHLQLQQKLGLIPPEEGQNQTPVEIMIKAIKCEDQRKARVPSPVAVKPREKMPAKLPGERNGDQLVRQRTVRDTKFAIAAQRAAMKKYRVKKRSFDKAASTTGDEYQSQEDG